VNVGLAVLFLVPFARWYTNGWLPLTALPYYVLYARDLRLAGYRRRDVIGIYALNLLLVPVNLGGVLRSLHQAITGRVTPFKRTPKVSDHTPAPPIYILAPQLLMLLLIIGSALSFMHGRPWQAAASAVNGLVLVYALVIFVGWRGSWSDLVSQLRLPRWTFPIVWTTAARTAALIAGAAELRKRKLVSSRQLRCKGRIAAGRSRRASSAPHSFATSDRRPCGSAGGHTRRAARADHPPRRRQDFSPASRRTVSDPCPPQARCRPPPLRVGAEAAREAGLLSCCWGGVRAVSSEPG
jgi:hypothetical protein